jgi:glycosyltransferase involved in cell wall biosynthesis
MNTIVFLQSEIHNYHISLIKYLTEKLNYNVISIYIDKNTSTPFRPPVIKNVNFIGKSSIKSYEDLIAILQNNNVCLVRVSGWKDYDYLQVAKYFKKKNIKTVVCSDTQWKNTFKQTLGSILFNYFIRKFFTHIMVAGPYQYEYARKLKFRKNQIIFENLSADSFVYENHVKNLRIKKSKKILYVGRFDNNKISCLIKAWELFSDYNGWQINFIGNGELSDDINNIPNFNNLGYKSNIEISQIMKESDLLILPSIHEQWGLVMHEAALSGLPIICSDSVGSIPLFLINGYNGFSFKAGNPHDLKIKLQKFLEMSEEDLLVMKKNSLSIGRRITTSSSAASLVSIIR